MLVVVLAHQRMREKGALHGRVWIVGAEQRRVVLHVFGVGGLGEERAAHGLDAQYGRFAPQALVDRIGIARELRDRDGLVQGGPRPRSAWGDPVGCGPICAEAEQDSAGAKQRNPGVRRTRRREAGTLLLRAGTECEIMPGENPPSTGTIAPLKVIHASDDKPAP